MAARRHVGTVGELDWTLATNGILHGRDRARLLGQGALVELRSLPGRLRRALGLRADRLAWFDLDRLRFPDTPACREAERLCSKLTPAVVLAHSQRSYVWSAILADHDGIDYDEELLYASSLLHDLGWVERPATHGQPECFTLVGAQAALELTAGDWDEQRRRQAAEAVTLHLNLRVGREHGPEAHLLWAGTRLDGIGLRHWDMAPQTITAVLERYPRLGLKDYFQAIFEAEIVSSPGSRAYLYGRYLGAGRRIARAPFPE